MARGKYSPTVTFSYQQDQKWFEKFSNGEAYDPEGYDHYGYNKDEFDRAGFNEHDYIQFSEFDNGDFFDDGLALYMNVSREWQKMIGYNA